MAIVNANMDIMAMGTNAKKKKILSVRDAVHSLNAKMAFASALNPTMGMDIIAELSISATTALYRARVFKEPACLLQLGKNHWLRI